MPVIPPQIIDEVRFATDIVDLVSQYVTLKRSGRNFFGLCPFHGEKTASFSVNPEKQIFHCFGCGLGGSAFAFVQRIEGIGFPEAVRLLAKRAGIAIPEPDAEDRKAGQEKEGLYFANQLAAEFFQQIILSEDGRIGKEYLNGRGFDDEALRAFGVGFAPGKWDGLLNYARQKSVSPDTLVKAGLLNPREKDGLQSGYYDRFRNRVMFPIHNLSGRVIAFGGRRIIEDDSPKYINSPETAVYHKGSVLYGFHLARELLRQSDCLIIVEGYLDVMRMHLGGFKNTVATSGTALTESQARLILRYTKNVVMLFDSDAAGSAATMRGADVMVENGLQVRVGTLAAGEDPDSLLLSQPAAAMQAILDEAPPLLDFKMLHVPAVSPAAAPSTQQRNEQVRSIIETLARMDNGLERQAMVHRMAEKLKVDEAVLWEEISRLRRMRSRGRRRVEVPSRPNVEAVVTANRSFAERSRTTELELIRIMALFWEAIEFVFAFMHVEDFHDPQAHAMAVVFQGFRDLEMPLEPEALITRFHDPEQAAFISRVVNEETRYECERDYRVWGADCMVRLQQLMLDDRISEILAQIKTRQESGGDTFELTRQLSELVEQRKHVKPENFLLTTA